MQVHSVASCMVFCDLIGEMRACFAVDIQARPVQLAPSRERFGLDDGSDGCFSHGFDVSLCFESGAQPILVPLEKAFPVAHERHAFAKCFGLVPRQADDANVLKC